MKQISAQDRQYEYSETSILGKGAFAEVYKGKYVNKNEQVAIKVIKKGTLKKYGDDILNAIGSEVNILQKLSCSGNTDPCPFIVRIYDCFETSNNIYIILEFCNQGTLQDILNKKKKLTEEESKFIIYQVVQGIHYIAKQHIAHRDLKPENIFINNGIYKLGDFGFASQKNLFQTTLGTYPYMGPEFFNSNQYGIEVDMWALGVMLHQMMFENLYFIASTQFQVAQNVLKKKYEVPPNKVSKEAEDFLYSCLEKDKSKRITAEKAVQHKFFSSMKNDSRIMDMVKMASYVQNQSKIVIPKKLEIYNTLINVRNGIFFSMSLAEELQQGFLDDFKFDIFFIIKRSYQRIVNLWQQLSLQQIPQTYLKQIQQNDWIGYLQEYNQSFSQILSQDVQLIKQKFLGFYNYLMEFVMKNFQQNIQKITVIVNSNINEEIDQAHLNQQIEQCYLSLNSNYENQVNRDQQQAKKLLRLAYETQLFLNFDRIIVQSFIVFDELAKNKASYSIQDLIEKINTLKHI